MNIKEQLKGFALLTIIFVIFVSVWFGVTWSVQSTWANRYCEYEFGVGYTATGFEYTGPSSFRPDNVSCDKITKGVDIQLED